MEGYISVNFKVDSDQGRFVLKVYPSNEMDDVYAETLTIQQLTYLNDQQISRPVANEAGELLTIVQIGKEKKLLRLITFVEGTFMANAKHSSKLFQSLGSFIARLDSELLEFSNKGIEARQLDWDLKYINVSRQLQHHIHDPEDRKIVQYFFLQWDQCVYPKLAGLRQSIIHNDANDWNILIDKDEVVGIIDFGDCAHTYLISELAIALTYALFGKEDPISWAVETIKGYHSQLPLLKEELEILYYLIAGRLIMGLCKTANEKKVQPDNEYILISEQPAWNLLKKWITINPIYATNQFLIAAGFEPFRSRTVSDLLKKRHKSIGKVLSVSYNSPIHMDGAVFQYMYDKSGNTFLDAYNNIPHVGHQHPKVVEAGQQQMAKLNTNTRYLYDGLLAYAEKLLDKFPAPLNKVFFVNSGSAASDLAIRLAQNYTGKSGMVVMEHGYHGNTRLGIDISQYKYNSRGGTGKASNIIEAEIPDVYRGKYSNDDAGEKYAHDLISKLDKSDIDIAAFIAEPIVGCGGQVPLADGYLSHLYPTLRNKGVLCISDEVQTGFGRLGSHFWGFQMHGVVPDIVVLGKPMGNGHPMGAVVTTDEIAEAFNNGMEFFSSFGGNPVSCEIGEAVLDVIEEENLQQHALEVGNYFMKKLRALQQKFSSIGDVRGSGLFIGMELVKDERLTPNTELADFMKNELRNRHILVSTDGPYESVIKSKPPLCFTKENVDQVILEMENILLNQ